MGSLGAGTPPISNRLRTGDTIMANNELYTRWLVGTLLSAMLSMTIGSCGDDNKAGSSTAGTGAIGTVTAGATAGKTGTNAGASSTDPNAAATCPAKVYAALSDGCKACACGLNPQLAPSCQKPCWDFLACSNRAQSGKCATFAMGGAAMRPQFEACTMEECGAELAVPGAEVVSAYRSIIGACAVSMGDKKAVCADDLTKFISELAP
jgi:hypothetical protein